MNLRAAQNIEAEVKAYDTRDYRFFTDPRSWYQLKHWEKHALQELLNGNLQRENDAARDAPGGRVQAELFRMLAV